MISMSSEGLKEDAKKKPMCTREAASRGVLNLDEKQ